MSEQHKYYTLTEDVKTLIQYVQERAFDHLVIEAANRLNKAIEKGVDVGLAAVTINKSRALFEKERKQYAEDSRAHKKPWELWEWQYKGNTTWSALLENQPMWLQNHRYRRKPPAFIPKSYSGLNCKDAKHLIGKIVEGTNYPNEDWKTVKLINITNGKQRSGVFEVYHQKKPGVTGTYEYIRTCEETASHPTINIGGVELPKPEIVAPALGSKYWLAPACNEMIWGGHRHNINALQARRVHLTEERAKAWSDWWEKEVAAKIDEAVS